MSTLVSLLDQLNAEDFVSRQKAQDALLSSGINKFGLSTIVYAALHMLDEANPLGRAAAADLIKRMREEVISSGNQKLINDTIASLRRSLATTHIELKRSAIDALRSFNGLRMYIYVAGPYSCGDTIQNVRKAFEAGEALLRKGHVPFIPHFTCLWHFLFPASYDQWLEYDICWLRRTDALLRLPGASPGADKEVREAQRLGMPIFFDLQSIPSVRENGKEIRLEEDKE